MTAHYFKSSFEHILAELERIDLLIQMNVLQARQVFEKKLEFPGLFISEQEIDTLLKKPMGFPSWSVSPESASIAEGRITIDRMVREIAVCKSESAKQGITLRLEKLASLFNLTSFDVEAILICLAPELDLKYERIFSYLQDDITRKKPSVDLVLNLLCSSLEEKLSVRKRFGSKYPLFRRSILYLFDDPSQQNPPLLSKFLKLDERVVSYLLGENSVDFRLHPFVQTFEPNTKLDDLILPANSTDCLSSLAKENDTKANPWILFFKGPYGVGKQSAAEALCKESGTRLLVIEGSNLLNSDGLSFQEKLSLIMREATLQESAIYWNGFDTLLAEDKRPSLDLLLDELEVRRGLTFLAGNTDWVPTDALHGQNFVPIEFSVPLYGERLKLWGKSLNGNSPVEPEVDLADLANKFRLSGGQIRDAVATAKNRALLRSFEKRQIGMNDLYVACRSHSNRKLATLSQKIERKYTWDDIVLPNDQVSQLKEITNHVKYKHLVYRDWGFDRKISLGKGLNVLFYGPSGTGKTMAAEIVANALNLDLYKIDLSTVVSKYIGETEKNLSKIFKEAETSNSILFFDEADALFGKRSEVRDSHDRYANIEIGYLLQKMDEYEGVVILATNMKKNMDEAFTRRMHFTVEFPFPEENYRLRIWQNIFPGETPLTDNIDFNFLARKFKFSGGNIKNIAIASAFHAAENGQSVAMENLIKATKRELQKMGKLCVKADFEGFYDLIQENS